MLRDANCSYPPRFSIPTAAAAMAESHARLLEGLKRILSAAAGPLHEDQIVEAVKEEIREGKITQSLLDDPTTQVKNCLCNGRSTDKIPEKSRHFEHVGTKTWQLSSVNRGTHRPDGREGAPARLAWPGCRD